MCVDVAGDCMIAKTKINLYNNFKLVDICDCVHKLLSLFVCETRIKESANLRNSCKKFCSKDFLRQQMIKAIQLSGIKSAQYMYIIAFLRVIERYESSGWIETE